MNALSWAAGLLLTGLAAMLGASDGASGDGGATPADARSPAGGAEPPSRFPGDDEPSRAAREALVQAVARHTPGLDPAVLAALRRVPRHLFMPGASLGEAYADHAFPIGHRQTISQPTVVAIMSDALRLTGRERVLEIGTGSGYQAAVLAVLAREVYSIEIVAPLGEEAKQRLAALGYANVEVRIGDGYQGWPERAPFDRILLTAAPADLPRPLVEQLADGGIIVAPVGVDDQTLERWTKRDGRLARDTLGAVRFVPMVSATPPPD
jgi:protein-L-isoaspartate(D-aspartate) O-methyltransferase